MLPDRLRSKAVLCDRTYGRPADTEGLRHPAQRSLAHGRRGILHGLFAATGVPGADGQQLLAERLDPVGLC